MNTETWIKINKEPDEHDIVFNIKTPNNEILKVKGYSIDLDDSSGAIYIRSYQGFYVATFPIGTEIINSNFNVSENENLK